MKTAALHAILLLILVPLAIGQQTPKLDGNWWRALYENERVEFTAGYVDCYANDFGDKNNTFPESWYTYAPRITNYYKDHPDSTNRLAANVLFDVRGKYPPKALEGGETWTEKHWFFDGEYWAQMGTGEQDAFVQGYLACYTEHLSTRQLKFSLPASRYAQKISSWFESHPKQYKTAIADALYKFADGNQSAAPR